MFIRCKINKHLARATDSAAAGGRVFLYSCQALPTERSRPSRLPAAASRATSPRQSSSVACRVFIFLEVFGVFAVLGFWGFWGGFGGFGDFWDFGDFGDFGDFWGFEFLRVSDPGGVCRWQSYLHIPECRAVNSRLKPLLCCMHISQVCQSG